MLNLFNIISSLNSVAYSKELKNAIGLQNAFQQLSLYESQIPMTVQWHSDASNLI